MGKKKHTHTHTRTHKVKQGENILSQEGQKFPLFFFFFFFHLQNLSTVHRSLAWVMYHQGWAQLTLVQPIFITVTWHITHSYVCILKKFSIPPSHKKEKEKINSTVASISFTWDSTPTSRIPIIASERSSSKMIVAEGIDDEEKWLAEGIAGIQHHAFFMHRALVLPITTIPSFAQQILRFP